MRQLRLRAIYALHMILPLGLMLWHAGRLSDDTVRELLARFG